MSSTPRTALGKRYASILDSVTLCYVRFECFSLDSPFIPQRSLDSNRSSTLTIRGGRRDDALLTTMFNTGACVQEVIDLRANDLHSRGRISSDYSARAAKNVTARCSLLELCDAFRNLPRTSLRHSQSPSGRLHQLSSSSRLQSRILAGNSRNYTTVCNQQHPFPALARAPG